MAEDKKFYDYEQEGGTGLMFPRNQFRNIASAPGLFSLPFERHEVSKSFNYPNDIPYDTYCDPETNSYIWVIGGDAHCNVDEELGKYEEGVVLHCESKYKDNLIKKIKGFV